MGLQAALHHSQLAMKVVLYDTITAFRVSFANTSVLPVVIGTLAHTPTA